MPVTDKGARFASRASDLHSRWSIKPSTVRKFNRPISTRERSRYRRKYAATSRYCFASGDNLVGRVEANEKERTRRTEKSKGSQKKYRTSPREPTPNVAVQVDQTNERINNDLSWRLCRTLDTPRSSIGVLIEKHVSDSIEVFAYERGARLLVCSLEL